MSTQLPPDIKEPQDPSTSTSPSFERWRHSLALFTGMGLSPAEQEERLKLQDAGKLEKDWDKCEKWKRDLSNYSPIVSFLLNHLRISGCAFPSSSIQCHPCPENRAGGFAPEHGILLCQDRFFNKKHMEDTLAHELIHAYDHCRFKVDWGNLRHHACSEIRAANLSGDCRATREFKRGFYAFNKQHQACVKRRAILSVLANPSCKSPEMAEKAVNEVWESCFADTRPFDDIY
ncbi:mitochondrial inner membrane protease ATP23 [Cryptococcus amylolentus CBS 6039]|uniref:Mitochondrial inner membrane protease ATP23 n=2 Tax=Cryptococcus amylolentus TaxID=104669 RepID=A0A1E3HRI2_9TREE|nr:mitochondrial inner membrane protease ATP23 [Cryptococcus amylolentus CBS 6039]ODN78745.1 mitochondrial inner membrane protease ATP23 [Cryptococcus amylolentus CBS 6039]ODO06751.1 mitochondrial inner membrane protease ATP23 [Cryptococcus amylolentus CBS 6273]